MLALTILLATGLIVWLWLVWDMTREVRAGWTRGGGIKGGLRSTLKSGLRPGSRPRRAKPPPEPEPAPEPPPKPERDPRDWMAD